jgi:hypothetical protein
MSLPTYIQNLALDGYDISSHQSLTKDIVSLNVAFMTLVTLMTGIRMSIRLFMIHAAGLDDCTSPFILSSLIHSLSLNQPS